MQRLPPAVTVHGLPDLRAVLSRGRPATLLSAPGAALAGGCLWWLALMAIGRREYPQQPFVDILDCAAAPGRAMAALRAGQRRLILEASCPAFAAVVGAAGTVGGTVFGARPPTLDLAEANAARRLDAWLAPVTAPTEPG
ncbi:MAG: hypothetical protein JOY70_05385 [Acidisphaera sp.]|nr:hypothetical protein [Acidisphaera sp.]